MSRIGSKCLTENLFAIGFLSCKSISILRMPCVRELIEIQKEAEVEGEQELIEEVREGNIGERDKVVLENKYKGDMKYEYS